MITEEKKAQFETLIKRVETLTGVNREEFLNRSRKTEAVNLRMSVSVALRKSGWGTEQVGEVLDRDHSTIIYLTECYDKFLFQAKATGERSPYLDLAESLICYLHDNDPTRVSIFVKANKARIMGRNGSSLLAIAGAV